MPEEYEVVVVGGGPGGLTTALYTTRLGHETALINREGGRYTTVEHVHNVIGVSEETNGREITELALSQLEEYGADCYTDTVVSITRTENDERRFRIEAHDVTALADRVVLATGFKDAPPGFPELTRYTGHGLHYCLHCDAYSLIGEPVYVFGHTESATEMAMMMLNFTADVELLLHGAEPEWDEETDEQLLVHPLEIREAKAVAVHPRDGEIERSEIGSIEFEDGTIREYVGGFAKYGSSYNNQLAKELGCELDEEGAVEVDGDGRTSVEGVYAVGDLTHGQNQTPIAMGDGARAGLALHHELRTFPIPIEEIEAGEIPGEFDAPAVSEAIRESAYGVQQRDDQAGMTPADPEER
jgi:thioredoxin reductase (NADPH)